MAENNKDVKKEKPKTLFIELCDQRDSGFVLDGTMGTKYESRLTSPTARFIPNRGFRLSKGINPDTQKEEYFNEEIRYIKNHRELSVAQQNAKGIKPSKNKLEDKIIIKNGNFSVTREGGFVSLYDYLLDVYYREDNPNRPDSMTPIYRVVELGKKEEQLNEKAFMRADAIQWLSQFYQKRGKEYVYKIEQIDALCQLFLVYADSPAGKINGLMAHIENDPKGFLDKAMKFEQTIIIQIGHALELNVIKFEKNTAVYGNKEKVICDFGRGNLSQDTKINKLAEYFNSPENKAANEEFQIELAAAMEKQFQV